MVCVSRDDTPEQRQVLAERPTGRGMDAARRPSAQGLCRRATAEPKSRRAGGTCHSGGFFFGNFLLAAEKKVTRARQGVETSWNTGAGSPAAID